MAPTERHVVSRRQFLQGLGAGALGLTSAALLGCSEIDTNKLDQKLLTSKVDPSELPPGIILRGIAETPLDPTAKSLNATNIINMVLVDSQNPSHAGGIAYTLYKDKNGAKNGLEALRNQISTSSQEISDSRLPSSSIKGKAQVPFSGTIDIASATVDNVLVTSLFTNPARVTEIEAFAIAHLKRVK